MESSAAPGDVQMPKVAFKRLMGDLRAVRKAMANGEMPWVRRCEPFEDNMMNWEAELTFPEESPLQQSLAEFAASIFDEGKDALSIRVRFPPEYPMSPPEVWLKEPRLKYQSAPVTFGGKVCNSLLTSDGWVPATTPVVVLEQIRQALLVAGAEVDAVIAKKAAYTPKAQVGLDRVKTSFFRESGGFKKRSMKAMSAVLAAPSVGDVSRLEASDKIMLPFKYAEEVYGAQSFEAKTFFELKSQLGRKVHCALMDFVHGLPPEYVLLPHWVMEDMFIAEGESLQIRTVHLELCSYVKIQPHSVDFYDAVEKSGKDAKVLLRDSICKLSALTVDTAVPIEIGNEAFDVQVVDLRPQAAVAVIGTGEFEFEVDFDPAPDLEDEAVRKAREDELIARYKAHRDRHLDEKRSAEDRRAQALRAHYEARVASAKATAASEAGSGDAGVVDVALRLPGGANLQAHLPEGTSCAALVAMALESDWAKAAMPWDVQLLMAFPRRVLPSTEKVSQQLHRSVISVRQVNAPTDDEELFAAAEAAHAALGAPAPAAAAAAEEEAGGHGHDLPELDEAALEQRTKDAFEVQRWINSGLSPDDAVEKVEAGEVLPPSPEELSALRQQQQQEGGGPSQPPLLSRTVSQMRRAQQAEAAERRARGEQPEPAPPAEDLQAAERECKIQTVIDFTCVPYAMAFEFLEKYSWNVDTALQHIFDEALA